MKKLIFFLILPIFIAGCGLQVKQEPVADRGIYRSADKAETWTNISRVATVSDVPEYINTYNINFLRMDPTDHYTIYASTREKGLYVSYDAGGSWRPVLSDKGMIVDLTIDPKSPCTLYAATSKNIYKSIDCGRKWESTFFEKRSDAIITSLVIDTYETNNLFLGLKNGGKGEFVWSQDSGESWQLVKSDFRSPVRKIFVNPKDTRRIYLALNKGLWRSSSKGAEWEELTKTFKELELVGGETVYEMAFLPEHENGIIVATKYGLLKSEDGFEDWQAYILLQQPNKIDIQSMAINPNNSDEIYYGTKNGLYKTTDGGGNWITINPPSPHWVKSLLIDPEVDNVIYYGAWGPAQK